MKVKIAIFADAEGGFRAEVPGIPNCFTEGETLEEVKQNIVEVLEGLASIDEVFSESADEPYEIHEIEV